MNYYDIIKGSFEERRESALEKLTKNFESRGFGVQKMDEEDGPLLAVKLPTITNRDGLKKYDLGGRLELANKSDGLTCLRVTQGYARAYGLKPSLSGPYLAAGGIYVTWVSFKENGSFYAY